MLAKALIAASVLFVAAVTLTAIDLHQLYDEMYPVNGLRRDVLTLCHRAEPTFIRALETDRVGCYDSMPDPVERAIGWVRTSSRLAAMRSPSPVEVAERMLIAAIVESRVERLAAAQSTGYAIATGAAARPCEATARDMRPLAAPTLALALPDDRLARRIARGDGAALAALGLSPHGEASERSVTAPDLPVLSLGGAGASAPPQIAAGAQSPAEPPAIELGGDAIGSTMGMLLPPRGTASGCRTPA